MRMHSIINTLAYKLIKSTNDQVRIYFLVCPVIVCFAAFAARYRIRTLGTSFDCHLQNITSSLYTSNHQKTRHTQGVSNHVRFHQHIDKRVRVIRNKRMQRKKEEATHACTSCNELYKILTNTFNIEIKGKMNESRLFCTGMVMFHDLIDMRHIMTFLDTRFPSIDIELQPCNKGVAIHLYHWHDKTYQDESERNNHDMRGDSINGNVEMLAQKITETVAHLTESKIEFLPVVKTSMNEPQNDHMTRLVIVGSLIFYGDDDGLNMKTFFDEVFPLRDAVVEMVQPEQINPDDRVKGESKMIIVRNIRKEEKGDTTNGRVTVTGIQGKHSRVEKADGGDESETATSQGIHKRIVTEQMMGGIDDFEKKASMNATDKEGKRTPPSRFNVLSSLLQLMVVSLVCAVAVKIALDNL